MNETQAPQHIRDLVQEMVEVGVQLTTMLDHMYRFQLQDADSSHEPPPEILRDLVARTLQRRFRTSKREIQRATDILRLIGKTIADELILVEPGAFDDLEEDDFDGEPLGDLALDEPPDQNGNRFH